MTILDKILQQKEIEIQKRLREEKKVETDKPVYSLYNQLLQTPHLQVIAEIKRASPSKGMIQSNINPIEQAKKYERAGAACISVLTDEQFFKGSLADLEAVANEVTIPVLRKDFILHEVQIEDARTAGASIILLIVAALHEKRLKELHDYAESLQLEVLVEVHDLEEYTIAKRIGAKIIGVNNRNLKTFEVDLAHTKTIAAARNETDQHVFISESGIQTIADAELVSNDGADAILVGETLMRAEDVELTLRSFQVQKEGVY
ncbi:indole-3-glycerol phosphate synthase TrpC [Kurthia gibsonii]|uniref:indole-3-glycerol phosphate synthase TrpC n=1 Tax=Kurthia TaxID=1649 RepID=UPI000745D788|nr:indole-3-glycerol phosphate synthase TrpC [Kurthia sp. 11kri321]AMA63293.1 N-acetylmannosamine-6-phosphate epimerase family protein [Kurthia sp. 11kri321]